MFLFVVLGGPLPSKLNALVIYVPTKMAKRTKAVGSHPLPSELNLRLIFRFKIDPQHKTKHIKINLK